ncbi:hypothetical protein FOZ62_019952, partial [Perkinsus olseni]
MATLEGSPPPATAATVEASAQRPDLRVLRRELARARRSLAEVREALNNVIEDGTEDNRKTLDELHEREKGQIARISDLEAQIAEAQATIDADLSERARSTGLSRVPQVVQTLPAHDERVAFTPEVGQVGVRPPPPQFVSTTSGSEGTTPHESVSEVRTIPTMSLADLNRLPLPEVQSGPY